MGLQREIAERPCHGRVPAHRVPGDIAVHDYRRGTCGGNDLGHDGIRSSSPDQQTAASGVQLGVERRQVRRQEIPSSTAGLTDREGVHHEQGHHPVSRGSGCGPGRVIGEAEVPTEPDKGSAHSRINA